LNKGELTALLGGWEGYSLGTVGRMEPDEAQGRNESELRLELWPGAKRRKCCSGCGQEVDQVHDVVERWVRDLPILGEDAGGLLEVPESDWA
jgi:transposase